MFNAITANVRFPLKVKTGKIVSQSFENGVVVTLM